MPSLLATPHVSLSVLEDGLFVVACTGAGACCSDAVAEGRMHSDE